MFVHQAVVKHQIDAMPDKAKPVPCIVHYIVQVQK